MRWMSHGQMYGVYGVWRVWRGVLGASITFLTHPLLSRYLLNVPILP